MKASKLDYGEQRDNELLRVFLSYLTMGYGTDESVRLSIDTPCSRYWTSPENAFKRISAMRRGKEYTKKGTRASRLSMFAHIMCRCGGDYSVQNIERVVYSGAPRFFLTFETAKKYIYNTINKRKKCRGTSEK